MRRDTYHDFITDEAIQDAGSATAAAKGFRAMARYLLEKSGAANCRSGAVHWLSNSATRTYDFEVRFDSRAWTGLA